MSKQAGRKIVGVFMALFIVAGLFNPQAQSFLTLPSQQKVLVGDNINFDLQFPEQLLRQFILYVEPSAAGVLNLNGSSPKAASPGNANVQIRLFGILPVKNVSIEVIPKTRLVPGGQSVGVLLHAQGVIVVGQSIVQDKSGAKFNPALEAGIQIGDVITSINGQKVNSDSQVSKIIDEAGRKAEKVKLTIKRKNKAVEIFLDPILCRESNRFRIGLYIRDSAAGVGTLSFYNPETRRFAALGHIITDADTNQPINISGGRVVRASIQGLQAGQKGRPGEKIGTFMEDDTFWGDIEKNSKFGIYGSMKTDLTNALYPQALPIALADQVKTGPAEMLTVLDGEKIEKFEVEIKKVLPQSAPDSKGLIIEVTDPRLLKRTGGIIQGMSGSPLIQNGRIIGAVTHVFINDPTRGYGCLIEWMLMESNGSIGEQRKAS